MEQWTAKVIVIIGEFILPFLFTILPIKLNTFFAKKGEQGKRWLSCIACFGGGVFFATFILHMGPEVREILHTVMHDEYGLEYPLADLLMGVGFFIVLYMERIVIHVYGRQKKKQNHEETLSISSYNLPTPATKTTPTKNGAPTQFENGHTPSSRPNSVSSNIANGGVDNMGNTCKSSLSLEKSFSELNQPHSHHHEADLLTDRHSTRALVLIVALSLHHIFEGLSVGLQHQQYNVWNLFIAIMCHEIAISFSLGLEFVKNEWSVRRILTISAICSAIMPVGTIIGTLIVELGSEESVGIQILNGVMQAIACGTFIYVTFFEILGSEIDPSDPNWGKPLAVVIGFFVMAALCAIPEESDEVVVNVKNGTFLGE